MFKGLGGFGFGGLGEVRDPTQPYPPSATGFLAFSPIIRAIHAGFHPSAEGTWAEGLSAWIKASGVGWV